MLFKFMLYTYGIIHCTLTVTDVQNGGRGGGRDFFFWWGAGFGALHML